MAGIVIQTNGGNRHKTSIVELNRKDGTSETHTEPVAPIGLMNIRVGEIETGLNSEESIDCDPGIRVCLNVSTVGALRYALHFFVNVENVFAWNREKTKLTTDRRH